MMSEYKKRLLSIKDKAIKTGTALKIMRAASHFISHVIKSGQAFYGPLPDRQQINEMIGEYLYRRDSMISDKITLELIIRESLQSYNQIQPDLNP